MSETVIDLHTIDNKGAINHGGGLELLMNDKRQKSQSIDIGLGELSELENELNNLTDNINIKSKPIEDLYPFLDRDEFLSNMIIPPLEEI